MPFFTTTNSEKSNPIDIYYEDFGTGKPIILIHGWPLSHAMWEYQVPALVENGYRVISYDRRGFGTSSRPYNGYDYNTMSTDLKNLIDHLSLKDVILVGFSMGGGELARYVGQYGTANIEKLVFLSSIAPFMMKTESNKDGVPEKVFEEFKKNIKEDRLGFLKEFGNNFVNYDQNEDKVSDAQLHYNFALAASALPKATLDCIDAFGKTDMRDDLKKIDVPTMFIHGTADEVVPPTPTAKQGHEIVNGSRLEMIEGAPHGCVFTHTEKVNSLLLDFLK
ncbi:alpha/beta fold hydrolase [Dokdonia sp. Hel_I_53]|uniref:alpha/beta fold hydrolase n=1 Tax=Dokdonia sp. Hel_I_53 TaxID=1566287 RepID=UPI00119A2BC3|nr:alpha/beta hydrolase [Dokdonia sp. Hel_I_53]TVZ51265.1 peroxiredoxin [Dokdonia sp. Hel_I_53]